MQTFRNCYVAIRYGMFANLVNVPANSGPANLAKLFADLLGLLLNSCWAPNGYSRKVYSHRWL